MDIQNITKEQFETLILIRSLEEFISDKREEYPTLSEAVWNLAESLSDEDFKQLVLDICGLTEDGYLRSDGKAETVEVVKNMKPIEVVQGGMMPKVKRITLKGKSALKELEKKLNESPNKKEIAEEYIGNRFGIRDKIISDVLANTASVISIISSVLTIVAILMGMGG